ncbi:exo-alpha-sialidase [Prosthecobacter sp.]|uniref:exo-alpha-sialidase n=1 Tax=Prosthecobacter sp. TaxID=1965333 RepID=UPI0037851597
MKRRHFLRQGTAGMLAASLASGQSVSPLIASVEKITLKRGRDGSGPSWFHPRPCLMPSKDGPVVLMTMQEIRGSDFFMPVHWMESRDLGKTWSEPQPIPALGRDPTTDGRGEEGVCDVVPQYHAKSGTVLALGHNVFYRGPRFEREQPPRCPVYAVYKNGQWSGRKRLAWDDPRGATIYTNNCGQREVLEDGSIAFVMSFGAQQTGRSAAGVRCSFDGETLAIQKVGREMKHAKGRGLLEPSLVRYRGKSYVTLRAEDNRGYVAASDDGLDFEEKQPWCWEDGTPLEMSTTQQHWLPHSEALHLVYTRKDASNLNVIRWRSPLFMAQVDLKTLRLIRETERVVLPLEGDGIKAPDEVPLMGNFQTTNISPEESWVTDGGMLPKYGFKGDLLLGKIRWSRPNTLV